MKAQTEELLYFLLWTADMLMNPTWRNLNDSFEQWAWRNRLGRRLAELERQRLIERHPEPNLDRVVRLTEEGRRLALGGRDPEECWSRRWDGRWRLIFYDVPMNRGELRERFRRKLRQHHFGLLQGSVWISPNPVGMIRAVLCELPVRADALVLIEGCPASGETDADLVAGAWDFPTIGNRYARYLKFLEGPLPTRERFREWSRVESTLWRNAVKLDPLLPQSLLPAGYLGRTAWQRRSQAFFRLGRLMDSADCRFDVAGATRNRQAGE